MRLWADSRTDDERDGGSHTRNELTVDVGIVAAGIWYARRIGDTRLSLGAGVWGAWEPANTFDRNVWEPLGIGVFGRYRPVSWLHADVGVAAARYVWADDCSGCSGRFVGIRTTLLAGHRFIFIGPELAVGRVRDDQHGSDYGALWGVQLRFLAGW